MKILWILLGLGTVGVLIGAFFLLNSYIYNEKQAEENGESPAVGTTVELEGTVTGVNFTQIALDGPYLIEFASMYGETHTVAIPSMGLPLCAANAQIDTPSDTQPGDLISVRGVLNETEQIVPCEDEEDYFRISFGSYVDPVFGYRFSYEKGKDGYVRELLTATGTEAFLAGAQLMRYEDFAVLITPTGPREGPPTIAVRVYDNSDNLSAPLWVDANPDASNIALAQGEPEEAVIGGANAVRYLVDGLYPTQTYAVAHDGHIFLITGAYMNEESDIYRDFQSFLASFIFVPTLEQFQSSEVVPEAQADGQTL